MNKKVKSSDMFEDYDSADELGYGGTLGTKAKSYAPCYEKHPVIEFKNAPGKLYGGSCHTPKILTADVYVGLDSHMGFPRRSYPWEKTKAGPIEVHFKIVDQAAPSDVKQFVAMIGWLKLQLMEGRNVHVGCFGGHGRTGLVLAALVKEIDGIEDAITHVRKVYCEKIVESKVQAKFLNLTFGITEVAPSKMHLDWTSSPGSKPRDLKSFQRTATARDLKALPDYSDRWNDYIPGTSITRTRGPRDNGASKSVKKEKTPDVIKGLKNSVNSIW